MEVAWRSSYASDKPLLPDNALVDIRRYLYRRRRPDRPHSGDHDKFLTDRGHPDEQKVWQAAKKDLNKRISVPAVGDFRLIDILAADAYRSLRAHHRQQREQRTKAAAITDGP
jgi:hypothetical protein